jgi:hypothetical protein
MNPTPEEYVEEKRQDLLRASRIYERVVKEYNRNRENFLRSEMLCDNAKCACLRPKAEGVDNDW